MKSNCCLWFAAVEKIILSVDAHITKLLVLFTKQSTICFRQLILWLFCSFQGHCNDAIVFQTQPYPLFR